MRNPLLLLAAALMAVVLSVPVLMLATGTGGLTPESPGGDTPVAAEPGSTPSPVPQAPPPAGMAAAPAPIDGLSVRIAESFPAQYFVDVRYGLPSGCARPGGYRVERSGSEVRIAVWNFVPADPGVMCTMIYGTGTHAVALGSDFTAGQSYTVVAGTQRTTFTAQ